MDQLPLCLYYPDGHAAHAQAGHPERPERVEAVRSSLVEAGWWRQNALLAPLPLDSAVLQTVHSPAYLSLLEMACRRGSYLDGSTYTTPASWELARQAAGGAAAVAEAVWRGLARRGFALARPPGHHARHGQGMGFCLLNNIALAAECLIQREGAQRLAIVDLDLHHGNGTQDIFWRRGDVLYISTHQSPLYPGTGWLDETGQAEGQGTTVNLPLPPFSGDCAYQSALEEVILPLVARFNPQMILVSYGFDPHWRDPLGHMLLSAAGYGRLIAGLTRWAEAYAGGRLALVREGGYDLDAAAACSQAVVAAMLGSEPVDPLGPSPYEESNGWRQLIHRAKQLWSL